MFNFLKFKRIPKSFLGIDIGTSSIRAVELGRHGPARELKNYGEIATSVLQKPSFRIIERNSPLLSNNEIAKAISAIVKEANIKTKEVNFDWQKIFHEFSKPNVIKHYDIKFKPVNEEKVKHILVHEHEFSDERISNGLAKLKEVKEKLKQKTLF